MDAAALIIAVLVLFAVTAIVNRLGRIARSNEEIKEELEQQNNTLMGIFKKVGK